MLITLLILCYIFNSKTDAKLQLFYYLIVFFELFFQKKNYYYQGKAKYHKGFNALAKSKKKDANTLIINPITTEKTVQKTKKQPHNHGWAVRHTQHYENITSYRTGRQGRVPC